jgi:regulator of CtrA degradation
MRLTTRLMQLASWLLLQRAVAEGEMTPVQARQQKEKVRLSQQNSLTSPDSLESLPAELRDLIAASLRLQDRIMHLDRLMEPGASTTPQAPNPVALQHMLLRSAFRT